MATRTHVLQGVIDILSRFMDLDFMVAPNVLRPRLETELLASRAISLLADNARQQIVIDMCCGCGNIAVALAVRRQSCLVWAVDLSDTAIGSARDNVGRHGLTSRVKVREGNLFAALQHDDLLEKVDMVVCNPPYISSGKLDGARAELLEDEPRAAFDGGPFGLSIHQRAIREARPFLKPGGLFLCEFGEGQARQIERLFARARVYGPVGFATDSEGRARVAVASLRSDMHDAAVSP